MKYFTAYVPYYEKWLVYTKDSIIADKLDEERANHLASALNAIENNYFQPEVRTIEQYDFLLIYNEYPRKEGKTMGLKRLKQTIKTKEKFDLLFNAVRAFRAQCENERREHRFIPLFSTWVNRWEDYIPSGETGSIKQDELPMDIDELTKRMGN